MVWQTLNVPSTSFLPVPESDRVLETIILAVVQGIAEFLPISSSGHLVILGALMNQISGTQPSATPTLEIILHAGTLGSILVVFWRRILDLLSSDRRVIPLLIVGTIPAAVIGITIKKMFPEVLKNPTLAGAMLIVTGLMLIILGKLPKHEETDDDASPDAASNGDYRTLPLLGAFIVGCFQAFAILPGISRSGSTILGGRLLKLKTDEAVTFSFLLAIPAIGGAAVLELKDVIEQYQLGTLAFDPLELVIGAFVSFVVGIVALKWLIGWSRQERLHWFAAWCIPAGILVLALKLTGVV